MSRHVIQQCRRDLGTGRGGLPHFAAFCQTDPQAEVNSDNWASYTFENQSLFAVGANLTRLMTSLVVILGTCEDRKWTSAAPIRTNS